MPDVYPLFPPDQLRLMPAKLTIWLERAQSVLGISVSVFSSILGCGPTSYRPYRAMLAYGTENGAAAK